jgi:hypothetical protein
MSALTSSLDAFDDARSASLLTRNILIARPFVKLGTMHVDWFSLEPEHCAKNVECIFVSYCRPSNSKMPPWMHDDRRATMLKYCIYFTHNKPLDTHTALPAFYEQLDYEWCFTFFCTKYHHFGNCSSKRHQRRWENSAQLDRRGKESVHLC